MHAAPLVTKAPATPARTALVLPSTLSRALLALVGCGLLVLVGCAQGGGTRRDAGAGTPDASPTDAGPGLDAPFVGRDAGPPPDAFVPPGTDAFVSPDAGTDAPAADAYVPPGIDAYVPPAPDAFVPMADAFVSPDAYRAPDAWAPDAFVPPDAYSAPDTGTGCSESPCRLVSPQCGCAVGQSCYPNGSTRVCAATGTGAWGDTCSGISSCSTGNGCVNFSSDVAVPGRMCSRMCNTDADCGSGSLCIHQIGDGMGGTVPGLRFCSRNCTPVPQAGCAPGLACSLFQETAGAMRTFTDCAGPTGTGTQGTFCVDETDCRAGYGCADAGLGNQCLQFCRVASPSCPGATTCYSIGIVGGVEWGLCA